MSDHDWTQLSDEDKRRVQARHRKKFRARVVKVAEAHQRGVAIPIPKEKVKLRIRESGAPGKVLIEFLGADD